MTNDSDIHRDLGRLEARVDGLDMRTQDMHQKLDVVYEAIVSARGGWKTLMWVGGAAASVGAGLAALFQWFMGGRGPAL